MIAKLIDIVREHGAICRVRMSSSKEMARIDLFCLERPEYKALAADLITDGWSYVRPALEETPNDIHSFIFTHPEITEERLNSARVLVKAYVGDNVPFDWENNEQASDV